MYRDYLAIPASVITEMYYAKWIPARAEVALRAWLPRSPSRTRWAMGFRTITWHTLRLPVASGLHTVFITEQFDYRVFREAPQIGKLLDAVMLLYGQTIAH